MRGNSQTLGTLRKGKEWGRTEPGGLAGGGEPEAHELNCWLRKWVALLRTLRAASRPRGSLGSTGLVTPALVSVLSELSATKWSCYWGF